MQECSNWSAAGAEKRMRSRNNQNWFQRKSDQKSDTIKRHCIVSDFYLSLYLLTQDKNWASVFGHFILDRDDIMTWRIDKCSTRAHSLQVLQPLVSHWRRTQFFDWPMDINIWEEVLKNSNWSLVSEPCTTSEPSDSKGDIASLILSDWCWCLVQIRALVVSGYAPHPIPSPAPFWALKTSWMLKYLGEAARQWRTGGLTGHCCQCTRRGLTVGGRGPP